MDDDNAVVERLFERCRQDHESWINGDPSGYVLPEDATLMGAFGGSMRGGPKTTAGQRAGNSMWESGSGDVQLVDGGASSDLAWLVMIERASVTFVGSAQPVRWDLRVTELFRRHGADWERFHRHADPLVDGHSLDEVLGLLG